MEKLVNASIWAYTVIKNIGEICELVRLVIPILALRDAAGLELGLFVIQIGFKLGSSSASLYFKLGSSWAQARPQMSMQLGISPYRC